MVRLRQVWEGSAGIREQGKKDKKKPKNVGV
jgi:hypothetical protein